MDPNLQLLIFVALLLILLFSGMRIAFGLSLVGIIAMYLFRGSGSELMFAIASWRGVNSMDLAAIPLFVFMGVVLFESGISTRVYKGISPIFEHFPGGVLQSNIAVGAVFAAASGSSVASAATIGTISLPMMEKLGYQRGIALGSVAAGGTLGILIPPSIAFIVYGALVGESIGRLFLAGFVPGIMLSLLYMTYIGIRVKISPELAPRIAPPPWGASFRALLAVWPILFLVVLVLVTIYIGVATPSEAAALGAAGSVLLAIVYRELSWKLIKDATLDTVRVTSMIMMIFIGAKILGIALSNLGIARLVTEFIVGSGFPKIGVLLGIFALFIVLGMLMDLLAAMMITLPIIYPVMMGLGFDSVWYGVAMTMLSELALISPPVGMILFVLQGLNKGRPIADVYRGCIPFNFVLLGGLAIVTIFPQLALWLPNLVIGRGG